MIHFPLSDGNEFVVIEPGNVRRLKDGKPLKVGGCLVAFTPDIEAFLKILGVDADVPSSGSAMEKHAVHLTLEQLDDALKACQNFPDVER